MQVREPHAQAVLRLDVLDAEGNDYLVALAGEGHFPANIFAGVAMFGEDQQHCAARLDRIGDFVVERPARPDVARRDPAVEAPPFELLDDRHGGVAILADMADEQEYFSRRHAPEPFAAPIPISLA